MAPKVTGFKLPFLHTLNPKETKIEPTTAQTFVEKTGLGQKDIDRASLDLQSPYAAMGLSFSKRKTITDIAQDIISKEFPYLKPMTPEIARDFNRACTNLALQTCPKQYMEDLALANPETALHAEQFINKFLS